MDKQFHPTLNTECNSVSMLRLNFIYVSKMVGIGNICFNKMTGEVSPAIAALCGPIDLNYNGR